MQVSLKRYSVLDIYLRKFLSRTRTSTGRYSLSNLPEGRRLKIADAESESDRLLRQNILKSQPTNFLFGGSQVWQQSARELREEGELDASELTTLYFRIVETVQTLVGAHLSSTHYIGPLRERPRRLYEISGETPREVGTRGKFAPEILFRDETHELMETVNGWLAYFYEGRRLETVRLRDTAFELTVSGPRNQSVNFADTGFGLSQILPLLVQGAYADYASLIIAEQPEIHLNPRLQASLARFYSDLAGSGRTVLIETHSEHLLLALRRLVAEGDIDAADIALYFVEPNNGISTIREVPIQENGNILREAWPKGFFEDALHEAFALAAAQQKRKG